MVLAYSTKPSRNMVAVESMKLRFCSMRKSTTGSFCRNSQSTTPTSPTNAITAMVTMKFDPNQSFFWPSSSVISSEVAVLQHAEIHYRLLLPQFPEHHPYQPDQRDHGHGDDEVRPKPVVLLAIVTDRKSTRLNSSHLVISYAV